MLSDDEYDGFMILSAAEEECTPAGASPLCSGGANTPQRASMTRVSSDMKQEEEEEENPARTVAAPNKQAQKQTVSAPPTFAGCSFPTGKLGFHRTSGRSFSVYPTHRSATCTQQGCVMLICNSTGQLFDADPSARRQRMSLRRFFPVRSGMSFAFAHQLHKQDQNPRILVDVQLRRSCLRPTDIAAIRRWYKHMFPAWFKANEQWID